MQNMDFKRYNSITNSYDDEFIAKVKELSYDGPWYISEKIHGANCQLSVTEDGVEIGGRNQITDNELMRQELLKYAEKASALFNSITVRRIILFGEFFGGQYPHKDVPRDKEAKKVQKGVWYSPHNHVLFFDLFIEPLTGKPYYANLSNFRYLLGYFDIPRVGFKRLKTFEEALNYPNDELSEIYKLYDLPEIENNIREGVVIRPETDLWIGDTRVIIKNKNERFKEVWKERRPVVDQKELTEKQIDVLGDMLRYVTECRAVSILSHYGTSLSMKVLGPFIKDMNTEVIQEFEKYNNVFNSMEKTEIKEITRRVNKKVSEICKKVLTEQLKEDK